MIRAPVRVWSRFWSHLSPGRACRDVSFPHGLFAESSFAFGMADGGVAQGPLWFRPRKEQVVISKLLSGYIVLWCNYV